MSDPAAGRRIARYEIVRTLGHGSMGVVYLARDVDMGREVALKVIRRDRANEVDLARFQAEGEMMARMRHRGHRCWLHTALRRDQQSRRMGSLRVELVRIFGKVRIREPLRRRCKTSRRNSTLP